MFGVHFFIWKKRGLKNVVLCRLLHRWILLVDKWLPIRVTGNEAKWRTLKGIFLCVHCSVFSSVSLMRDEKKISTTKAKKKQCSVRRKWRMRLALFRKDSSLPWITRFVNVWWNSMSRCFISYLSCLLWHYSSWLEGISFIFIRFVVWFYICYCQFLFDVIWTFVFFLAHQYIRIPMLSFCFWNRTTIEWQYNWLYIL